MTGRLRRTGPPLLAALALTLGGGPALAQSPELWVVNELSRSVAIVDVDAEGVVAQVSLDDLPDSPYCAAFLSVSGAVSDFAFVSQGSFVRVIDTATRTVERTVDVGSFLGQPVRLLGCSGARPREFVEPGVGPAIRHYIHVAAQVEVAPGHEEPWFVVLDQFVLAFAPLGTNPIVAAGPLVPTPPGTQREAMEVVVLGTPGGPLFQRAWYTVREIAPDPTVFAVQVAGRQQLGGPWTVERVRATPTGVPPPDSLGVHAPFSRELPGLTEGTTGRLVNLDTEGSCDVGVIPRSVAIAGVGPGSYTVLVADRVDDGVDGALHLLNGRTCQIENTVPTGEEPVDVVTLGPIDWRKAFVANRESDSVTIFRENMTVETIPIPPPPPGGGDFGSFGSLASCASCPRSMTMALTSETACTVRNMQATVAANGVDIDINWAPVGCDADTWFEIWCVCEVNAASCPTGCLSGTSGCSPTSFEGCSTLISDGTWEPLGRTQGSGSTHLGAAGDDAVSYSIEPDDNEPQ